MLYVIDQQTTNSNSIATNHECERIINHDYSSLVFVLAAQHVVDLACYLCDGCVLI